MRDKAEIILREYFPPGSSIVRDMDGNDSTGITFLVDNPHNPYEYDTITIFSDGTYAYDGTAEGTFND